MVTLLDYWKEITSGIGVVITFIIGRKSAKFLEKKQQVDAIDTMQKTYDVFLKHYKDQLDVLTKRLDYLEQTNLVLTENSKNWETKFKNLSKQYESLKKEFETYKLKHE